MYLLASDVLHVPVNFQWIKKQRERPEYLVPQERLHFSASRFFIMRTDHPLRTATVREKKSPFWYRSEHPLYESPHALIILLIEF